MGLGRDTSLITIQYLGHAGFIVNRKQIKLLIDPWFYAAFLMSWFPFPDNRFLLEALLKEHFDYLYISHSHDDHFDPRVLSALNKDLKILCPDFCSNSVYKRLRAHGFKNILRLKHGQQIDLDTGMQATMFLDTSYKEDSALLLQLDDFKFLDLNDCHVPLNELPEGVDLLSAQYSGAQWYPNCYAYTPEVMKEKVQQVRSGFMKNLVNKCKKTKARYYLPSAGPACFLDPTLRHFNDRRHTIFPLWEDVHEEFVNNCSTSSLRIWPGDIVQIKDNYISVQECVRGRARQSLDEYASKRRSEWEPFYVLNKIVTLDDVSLYFHRLVQRNQHLVTGFYKKIRLIVEGSVYDINFDDTKVSVMPGDSKVIADYSLTIPGQALLSIIEGKIGWEEALLSMRIKLQRIPDIYDFKLMGLLRYGDNPSQTLQLIKESDSSKVIIRAGLRFQRFCPHAGEDLTFAEIHDGIITCPRHHWKWDVFTGRCISGGDKPLNVSPTKKIKDDCRAPDRR